jgi:hypothetical protein
MEYGGYEIHVRTGWVVLGEDPTADPVEGFTADVRRPLPVQDDPDGRIVYEFPFDREDCTFRGLTEDSVIAEAKAFIDEHGKEARRPTGS